MKKKLLILTLWCGLGVGEAQQVQYFTPYTPEPLPASAPRWMESISNDPTGVNYRVMDSLFRQWLADDVDARVKTIDRKPAVNFYRRWERAVRSYVREGGRIVLPTMAEHLARLDARNASRSRTSALRAGILPAIAPWRNIGPNATYENRGSGVREKDSQVCVYRIAVAPSDHNVVYSGTETGVVFRTSDKGRSWQACAPTHDFGGPIYAITVSPTDANTVYVGGGANLWKSTNGGASWQREPEIMSRVNSIRISPTNPAHITVSAGILYDSSGGFFVSRDGGRSYRQILAGLAHDHELQPGNPNRIYALVRQSSDRGFLLRISDDGGDSFRSVTLPVGSVVAGRLAVSDAPTGANYVYALVNSNPITGDNGPNGGLGTPHILRSTDAGETWVDQTTRSTSQSWLNTFSSYIDEGRGGQGYFDMMIGVSSSDPEHVIFGLCSSYRSTTGGKGSHRQTAIGGYQNLEGMHPDMQDIAVAGSDTWIATDGGIKYSGDFFATRGEDRHRGIYASDYHGFGQAWNEDVMVGGRWHNGDAVHAASYGEGNTLHVGGVEKATGHVMLSNPRKVYFSDAGVRMMPEQMDGRIEEIYGQYFSGKSPYETLRTSRELAFDPRYAHRLLIHSQEDNYQLYLSEDEGRSFRMVLDTEGEQICSYEFARSNPNHIYVSGSYDIHHSSDGGATWSMLPKRPFEMQYTTNVSTQIAVHPRDERTLWMAYSNVAGAVAYTTDQGQTWHYPLSDWMKSRTFHWILLVGDELNGVYLGTVDGTAIYYKDDSLSDWVDYSEGLNPGARITRLAPFYKEGKLRLATSQGIWERPLYRQRYVPVAQPLATNLGHGDLTAHPDQEVQLDSYSITGHEGTQWAWSFSPQPAYVSDPTARAPRVRFGREGHYDVTLTVTTPGGTHSRTIPKMIRIGRDTAVESPTSTIEVRPSAIALSVGEPLVLSIRGLEDVSRRLSLHAASGALIRQWDSPAGATEVRIETSDLVAGVYIYELRTATYKTFGKFIVR